jgi:PAS domain S-box-containing protein
MVMVAKKKPRGKGPPQSRKPKRSAPENRKKGDFRQEALKFAGIGLYRYKFDGTILYMDSVALRILDLERRFSDPSRVVGMNISHLMKPRGPQGILRRKLREVRQVHHFEYPFKTLSGIDKWTLHDCYLVKDPDSGEEVIQAVVRDNTDRKSMEEALQVSEKRYRLLLETSPDMVFQMDCEGRYLYVNPPAARIFNRRPEDLIGHNQSEFLPADLAEKQRERIRRVIQTGQPVHGEAPYLMGVDPVWVETRMIPIKSPSGEVFSVLGITRDISERKREEMRLEELNNCFLQFGSNHIENIHRLVTLCGTILGGTCALYNRLQDGMLHSLAHWNAPPDFTPVDRPEGHICHHVIRTRQDEVHVIRDLPNTSYGQSDPHVLRFGLKTYIGKAVSVSGGHVGSLCVVYQRDFLPSENDRKFLSIVAAAVSIEEQRRSIGETLREQRDFAENLIEVSQAIILVLDSKGCIVRFNPYLEQISGWRLEEAQGRDWFAAFVPEHERAHARELFATTLRISALGSTSPVMTRDGATRLVEWFNRVLKDAEGRVIGILCIGQDITERKRTEESFQERERFFKEILNSVQDGVSILDPDLNILFANLAMEKWYAHVMPLTDKKCFQAYHGRGEPCAVCPSIQTLKTRQPAMEVVPLVGEGKRQTGWLELFSFPLLDSRTRELKGVIEYVRNVTERKRAEEALNRSEYLYRTTMDSLEEWIHVVDKELRIVHMNAAFKNICRELGLGDQVLGRTVNEVFSFLSPQVWEEYQVVFRSGRPVTTVENTTIKGRTIVTETRKEPVFEEGKVVRVITIIRDVTERKEAEEALMAEKERLSITLRSIGDGVVTTDRKGCIVLLNPVAEKLAGCVQTRVAGKPFDEAFILQDEKTGQTARNPVQEVMEADRRMAFPDMLLSAGRDGPPRVIASSGAPIHDPEGDIIGTVLVFRDVTEHRRMEQELLKASKLESIGILAGGIAHDFNNILTVLLGNISLAMLLTATEDKIHDRLVEMERAALMAKDLTEQLLTFSKGGTPVKSLTSMAELIRESAEFALRGSNVKGEFHIADDLRRIEVDINQIGRVMNNLVINALQAMPSGGTVVVRAINATVTADQHLPLEPGDYIRVSVEDRGVGISPENLRRIFDPFFTTKEEGSGLGLSLSYSIITKHGGHLFAESRLGHGSNFQFYLPASKS